MLELIVEWCTDGDDESSDSGDAGFVPENVGWCPC
jgi:hypothetical protein